MTDHKALVRYLREDGAPLSLAASAAIEQLVRERDEALEALLALRSTTTPEAWVLIVPRIDAILAKPEPQP